MVEHDDNSRDSGGASAADDHITTEPSGSTGESSRSGERTGQSRRAVLKSAGALGVGALVGTGTSAVGLSGTASAASGDPWTIVAIPDTQYMTNSSSDMPYAHSITDWVVDNVDDRNIAFVTHEGDMVADGSDVDEWENADAMMSKLDGVVPYSPNVGNHDYAETFNRGSGAVNFRDYFGPSRFEGRSYFGGASPNERNFYQYFSAGGYEFLHISLEFEAPGNPGDSSTPIGWAQDILNANSDMPTILTTHTYLTDDPRQRKRDVEEADGDGNSGQDMWEKLVRPNPQIFMVLNGHNHDTSGNDDGEHHQVSTNSAGENVYEMLANFQDYPNGGDGWFRRIRFVPGGGIDAPDRIQVKTYTAYYDDYQTSDRSEFHFDLDFDSRFNVSGNSGEQVSFQQGTDGYAGTVDTQLHEANADTEYSDDSEFTVDGSDDGGEVHALVRFEDIVGSSGDQVPSGATVQSATLTVESTNPGNGATLHRMQAGWSDTDTWNDWGGIQADGNDAAVSPDAREENAETETTTINVTESVQAWANGEANNGWAFLPLGDNGWDFESAEGSTPPELTVYYEGDDGGDDGGTEEGIHVIDDTSVNAVWKPDFQVKWPDYVYFGSSIDGEPREWQLMDETSDNVFETTLGGLSAGDDLDYQFAYYDDGWQYTDVATYTFDPDGDSGSGAGTNRLVYGDANTLHPGEHLESATGDYRLYFQGSDGNLVLRDTSTMDSQWATMTNGDGGTELKLQGDGNLVMYTDGGDPVWASHTAGSGADKLVLEDDGSLVLSADGSAVWSVNN